MYSSRFRNIEVQTSQCDLVLHCAITQGPKYQLWEGMIYCSNRTIDFCKHTKLLEALYFPVLYYALKKATA